MAQAQSGRPEASTLSRSVSNAGNAQVRKELINGLSHKLDMLFPLMDDVLKDANIKPGPYLLLMVFICIQIIAAALWPQFEWQLRINEGIMGEIVGWIIKIALYTPLTDDQSDLIIRLVLFSILTFLYVAVIIYQLVFFKQNRRFIKWTLYLTRVVLDFIPLLMLIPAGNFVGDTFHFVLEEGSAMAIVFFALSLVHFAVFTFGHYMMSIITSTTSYLPGAPNACWEGKFHFYFAFGVSMFALIAWISKFFTQWLQPVIIVAKIVFDAFCVYYNIYLPFMHLESNGIVMTLFSIVFVLDVFAFVQFFGVKLSYFFHLVVIVVVLLAGKVITEKIIAKIVKDVKNKLSEEALEDIVVTDASKVTGNITADQYMFLQELEKRQLFMNYRLHRNRMKMVLYLRVGIANACPLFIDWSLIKFAPEFHNSSKMLALVMQMLSYFPSESRLLNYYFYTTTTKPNLTFGERFALYQVHRVKGFRQSSASSEITEKLMELKQYSNREINFARKFWEMVPRDGSLLYDFAMNTARTTHLFNESIDKWPNNCRLCDDFSFYLIECATNFTEGLKIKHRSELIEQGINFAVDYAFRHLVRAYPLYLKKNILDIKGNFYRKGIKSTKSASSSQGSSTSMTTLNRDDDLDIELEENLAKNSFTHPRLRLAFQRSLENRKSTNNKEMKVASLLALLLAILLIIFLVVWYYSIFDIRSENMNRQHILNSFRYGFDAAMTTLSIYWANMHSIISDELLGNKSIGLSLRSPKTNDHNLQFSSFTHHLPPELVGNISQKSYNMVDEMRRWAISSRDSINKFLNEMTTLAAAGSDVYQTTSAFVNNDVKFDFCEENASKGGMVHLNSPIKSTLKSTVIYALIKIVNVTQVRYLNASDWMANKGICECLINIQELYRAFNTVAQSLSNAQTIQKESVTKTNHIFLLAFSIGYFVICLPSLVIQLHRTLHELSTLMMMMAEIDKKSREEASQPLKATSSSDEQEVLNEMKKGNAISPFFLYSMVVIFTIVVIAILIIIILISENKNNAFLSLNRWLYYGISRGNYMLEAYAFTLFTIISVKKPGSIPMLTTTGSANMAKGLVNILLKSNNNLLRGAEEEEIDLPPCIGVNQQLDHLHFDDDCHGNLNLGGFHDTYRCASIDRGIALFSVLINEMIEEPLNVSMELDKTFYHAFHLMNDHIIDPTYQAASILSNLAAIAIDEFQEILLGISFGTMAFLILFYAYFYTLLIRIDIAFSGALQLLRRLPPLSVISNPALLNYLLNKKEEKTREVMYPSKSVIIGTKDAVFCLNRNESIEVVNKAVTYLFGYTPEQLLGQPISTIMPIEENIKLFEQFEAMRNGDGPLIYEANTSGITDDEQTLSISVTVLGITDHKAAESFVVIIRDISILLKQQEEAKEAKKQSETLLYQILPRDIVNRLNQGEKDISFVVPSSTVIFADIVKFSDYASNLTPAQIMENLSKVFANFDTACAKYNLITKIKLIGDVYMAAANLFTPDEQAATHASQVVQFGLDILTALEEVNAQLDSSLQVRIGVNTDGPLYAGVLGTDKPVFDIIGDPINVAARLQSNGIPGTVQISQTTFDAITGLNFNVEPRGEILLKGKGKKMAYIVRGKDSSSFFFSEK